MSLFSDQPFYHETITRLIVAFGTLFSGITISRKDSTNEAVQKIRVPLEYAPKNKWYSIIKERANTSNTIEITLPRMAFEITDYRYDAARKIGTPGTFTVGNVGPARAKLYNPVPYDVIINLYSFCKTQGDSLQILEQILPYFAPSMTVTLQELPTFNIRKEIPIVLQGVSVEDTYEGSPQDFRTVIQTFTFAAQVDLFGPIIVSDKVIKTAIADVAPNDNPQNAVATPTSPPGADVYTAAVNPQSANKDGIYTIDETWQLQNF